MSNVDLTIGGKSYQLACAPGDEPHVMALGNLIDEKLSALGGAATGQSDSRQMLMAALMLADELHELRQSGASITSGSADSSLATSSGDDVLATQLESLASRLEQIAATP